MNSSAQWLQIFILVSAVAHMTSFKIDVPSNFFGSPEVFSGFLSDSDTFKRAFTLDDNHVTASGSIPEVEEQLRDMHATDVQHLSIFIDEVAEPDSIVKQINLTSLARFTSLEHLWLSDRNRMIFCLAGIDANVTLPVKHLHFYLGTQCNVLVDFLAPFKHLQTLDVRRNGGVPSVSCFADVLKAVKASPIRAFTGQKHPIRMGDRRSQRGVLDMKHFSTYFNDTCEYLDFSHSHLFSIRRGAFTACPKLKLIDLSHNRLLLRELDGLSPFLALSIFHPTLEVVNIAHQVSLDDRRRRRATSGDCVAQFHDAETGNLFDMSCMGDAVLLQALQETDMGNKMRCNISNCNFAEDIPCSLMPSATQLLSRSGNCRINGFNLRIPIAPNLRRLNFSFVSKDANTVITGFSNQLCLINNKLSSMDSSGTKAFRSPTFKTLSFSGFEMVKEFTLQNGGFSVNLSEFGRFMPNVEKLDVSNNEFAFEGKNKICENAENIQLLDLSNSNLKDMPSDLFHDCKTLQQLNLSNTNIQYLDRKMMKTFDAIHRATGNLSIDLSGNIFHCHCHDNHSTTMHWLRHTDVTILDYQRLYCTGHLGEELISEKDWKHYAETCSTVDEIIKAVIGTTLFFVALFCIWQIHKHRYSLITQCYKLKLATRGAVAEEFDFDAYFCYVHDDDQAMGEICDFLELEAKLKCCVPQRDFGALEAHVAVMEQHMERSATTVVLLSHAALNSPWHKAERNLARYIELYRRFNHRLIHVCLQDLSDVTDDDVTPVIRSGEHLRWDGDAAEDRKKRFFERLVKKIHSRMVHQAH